LGKTFGGKTMLQLADVISICYDTKKESDF